jgi:hypothetical protein
MSTKEDKKISHEGAIDTGLEGNSIPLDLELPPCSIEDVDRSLFNLLDTQLPFQYEHKGAQKRVPVIFATGERFAVLRRSEPLRDKSGALILPLISLMRTGINQETTPSSGPHQRGPITIRRKIDKSSSIYKRLVNVEGFQNSDDHAHPSSELTPLGTEPGRVTSRGLKPAVETPGVKGMPNSSFADNIYETIVMPAVKYFTSSYEVTFWCQYTTQMNNMISAMMSMYQDNNKRTFRLETDKGYWFVGYVGAELTPQENFDDFSDDERLVKYTFTVSVNGYQVAPDYPGAPVMLRRHISAAQISFEIEDSVPDTGPPTTALSGDANAFLLEDMATVSDPLPGQAIGGSGLASSRTAIGETIPGGAYAVASTKGVGAPGKSPAVETVGGTSSGQNNADVVEYQKHPITGELVMVRTKRVSRNSRKGETVHRVLNPGKLGTINND